jgi:exoribonuclease-2
MIKPNALVLYKNDPALVTEVGEKITITYEKKGGGKETQRVREKDITLLHAGPLASLQAAFAYEKKSAADGKDTSRLDEAYELLLSDSDSSEPVFSLAEIADIAFNTWTAESAWAAYTTVKSCVLFAEIHKTPAKSGETAKAHGSCAVFFALRARGEAEKLLLKNQGKENEDALRKAFTERLKTKKLTDGDGQFMQEIEAFALGQTTKCRAMQDAGFSLTQEKAHALLLDTGFWSTHKNPYPARRGLSTHSAQEALASPPEEKRFDVPHTAFAIDSSWCVDPDDAVFFDGTYLWVHIADPASAVTPDSKADFAARNRGATLYLPEGAARMLCEQSLADYALGLTEFSRALSFKISFDEAGNIANCDVLKTRLKVRRYTYEQAEALKDSKELSPLFALAERNIQRREKLGAVTIDMPEVHIFVQNESITITPGKPQKSGEVVREMMLLAGEAAARFAFKNGIAFPYACQKKPDFPANIPEGLAGNYLRVKHMHSRTMSASPSAHAGLGLAMYSQVTSPLRRYGDLVAHQQLRAFIDGTKLLNKDEVLERIAQGDAATITTIRAERESNLHWTLVYLLEHPEWQSEAVVVDTKDYQATVIIPAIARQETLITSKKAALNDTFIVKAGKINLSTLSVQFVEVN